MVESNLEEISRKIGISTAELRGEMPNFASSVRPSFSDPELDALEDQAEKQGTKAVAARELAAQQPLVDTELDALGDLAVEIIEAAKHKPSHKTKQEVAEKAPVAPKAVEEEIGTPLLDFAVFDDKPFTNPEAERAAQEVAAAKAEEAEALELDTEIFSVLPKLSEMEVASTGEFPELNEVKTAVKLSEIEVEQEIEAGAGKKYLESALAVGGTSNLLKMSKGMSNQAGYREQIASMQEVLIEAGFMEEIAKNEFGHFGGKTKAAVEKMQEAMGIKVDGVVFTQSHAALAAIAETGAVKDGKVVEGKEDVLKATFQASLPNAKGLVQNDFGQSPVHLAATLEQAGNAKA